MASQFGVTQNNDDPSGPQPFDATSTTVPITQQNTPINKVNVQASSGGGGGGGSGIGGIIGAVGNIIGGLFAEGGLVGDKPNGFAEGGPAQEGDKNQALATGYLVGALHQKKFGGDPKTLGVAAQEIKQMLMPQGQQQGMADGGIMQNSLNSMQGQNSADQDLAIQSLMKALGVDQAPQENNTQQPVPQSANLQNNPAQNSPLLASPQAGATQGNMSPQAQPNRAFSTGGYMQYADGGPPMAPSQGPSGPPQGDGKPPLQPGQAFQGDGSVKGPGGPQDDAIPAKLSNGEFVFAQPAVQFYGVDKLMKMNEQGKQGFMQAQQQVQANQQPQRGPPGQPPMPPPQGQGMMSPPPGQPQGPPPPPGGMAQGGIMKTKGSGYMGC